MGMRELVRGRAEDDESGGAADVVLVRSAAAPDAWLPALRCTPDEIVEWRHDMQLGDVAPCEIVVRYVVAGGLADSFEVLESEDAIRPIDADPAWGWFDYRVDYEEALRTARRIAVELERAAEARDAERRAEHEYIDGKALDGTECADSPSLRAAVRAVLAAVGAEETEEQAVERLRGVCGYVRNFGRARRLELKAAEREGLSEDFVAWSLPHALRRGLELCEDEEEAVAQQLFETVAPLISCDDFGVHECTQRVLSLVYGRNLVFAPEGGPETTAYCLEAMAGRPVGDALRIEYS